MDGKRKSSTVRQLTLLLDFLEANRDLALGKYRSKEARELSRHLWRGCANRLNREGPARLAKEWCTVWNELKRRVRAKVMSASQSGSQDVSNVNVVLTPVEERVADIIGLSNPNISEDPLIQASNEENPAVDVDWVDLQHKESKDQSSDDSWRLNLTQYPPLASQAHTGTLARSTQSSPYSRIVVPEDLMDKRRSTTVRQVALLIDFIEANRALAVGKHCSKEAREIWTRLWRRCANRLNREGPARQIKEWSKYWNDMKRRVKIKLISLSRDGPTSNITLTPLEERIADLIGRSFLNISQDPLLQASTQENPAVELEWIDLQQEESNDQSLAESWKLNSTRSPPQAGQSPPQSPAQSSAQSSAQSPAQSTQSPPMQTPPTLNPQRHRSHESPYQRKQRVSRVHSQAKSSRGAAAERGAALRARSMARLARAALAQAAAAKAHADAALAQAAAAKAYADAAVISAEADRMRAHLMTTVCQSLSTLVPVMQRYFETHTKTETRKASSTDGDDR